MQSKREEYTLSIIDNLKTKLADHNETENTIQSLLSNWKITVSSQLKDDETALMEFLIVNLNRLLDDLQGDIASQEKINIWIKESISELLIKFHDEIGNMVRNSLIKLDNTELVDQIEGKVGNDLQYIRLNGAVVGGLVGIIIASLKYALN